ncbi:MAG: YciI family protein [Terriglobales bacterium]
MSHFFLRLIPPRPTFPADMNAQERELMGQHAAYFVGLFQAGKVIAYGPVMASEGAFGMAIFELPDAAEAQAIMARDPTIVAGLNRYTLSPMHLAASRSKAE